MADPEFKKEYEALAPIWELRKELIKLRLKEGKTQEQVAAIMGTKKSNISRLENVNSKSSPKLSTIEEYAKVAGFEIEINFKPLDPTKTSQHP